VRRRLRKKERLNNQNKSRRARMRWRSKWRINPRILKWSKN